MHIRLIKLVLISVVFGTKFISINTAYAEEKMDNIYEEFLNYLEIELFSESLGPDFLAEYRTGNNNSWNISKLVNSFNPSGSSQVDLVDIIEKTIPLSGEYRRFSNVVTRDNPDAYEINRYRLAQNTTDHLRTFSKEYIVARYPKDKNSKETIYFRVRFVIYKKHGEHRDTIDTYLFWEHL